MPKRRAVGISLGLSPRSTSARRRQASARGGGTGVAGIEALEGRQLLSATWFVATNGNDSGAGSLASPFRTIQRAATLAKSGDHVEIETGTYRETVKPVNSGVTFENYNGEKVTVSGADAVGGWSSYGNSIYQTSAMNWDLGEGNNQVFVDGRMINEARFPNTSLDVSHPTLNTVDSVSGNTIHDSSITQGNGYWTGAKIHITLGQEWVAYTGTVTNSGPGWISVSLPSTGSYEQISAGNHYYLYGKFQALDSSGEWYRDSSGKLYVRTPNSDNPANHTVEVKHRQYAFDLSGASNTTINGINIFAATIHTSASYSTNTTLNHINAQYVSQSVSSNSGWNPQGSLGIELYGSGSVLENSTIAYSSTDGVFVYNSNIKVINNTIHDVDYNATDAAGVAVYSNNDTVNNNLIYNTGRDGVRWQGTGHSIQYNTIHDASLQTTDDGGIYTVKNNGGGTTIAYNSLYNINSSGFGAVGVYEDNYSSNTKIHDNTTWNVGSGLKFNYTSYSQTVYNNKLGAHNFAIESNGWVGFAYSWSGTQLYNNVYYNSNLKLGAGINQWGNTYSSGSPNPPSYMIPNSGSTTTSPPAPASPPPPVSTPTTSANWTATNTIQAETYNVGNNVTRGSTSVGSIDNSDWMEFQNVNFGTGVASVTANLAVPASYAGQSLKFHLDSPTGTLIGTLKTTSTGSWSTYANQSVNVSNVTGIHTLYVVGSGTGGVCNLDWIKFATTAAASTTPTPVSTPTTTKANWTATNTIQAETYNVGNNVTRGTTNVGSIDNGDWIEFQNVDFGTGVASVTANLAVPASYAGRSLQFHLDSPTGTLIGTLKTTSTGSWNTFTSQSTNVSKVTGIHTLYVVGAGGNGVCNLDWIKFNTGSAGSSVPTPVSTPSTVAGSGATTAWSAKGNWTATNYYAQQGLGTKYNALANADNGDWVEYKSVDFGTGVSTFKADIAVPSSNAGQKIEIHVDGVNGPTIGVLTTKSTGSWSTFAQETASITGVTGVHDLYFKFVGSTGIANVSSFTFA